uniref:Uncharacterized protein n=1 Tax=Triticum urartu TaxID=4572 RepID=A0A8R7QAJ1_TRIUA
MKFPISYGKHNAIWYPSPKTYIIEDLPFMRKQVKKRVLIARLPQGSLFGGLGGRHLAFSPS